MILEVNVPKTIRNWAVCQVSLRNVEQCLEQLAKGQTGDPNHYWLIKYRGKAWFIEHVINRRIRRQERRCCRYRALMQAIEARFSPREYLAARREILEMIGTTLHYTRHGREVFETLLYCSQDGKKLFSHIHREGIDAVKMLSLGFGRTL